MNRSIRRELSRLRDWIGDQGLQIPRTERPVTRLLITVIACPLAVVYLWLLILPWPLTIPWRDPAQTSFMEYRLKEARRRGEELTLLQDWVTLEEISPNLKRAVLAAEDDRFYQHGGIDWLALAEEVRYQGDSTSSWWAPRNWRAFFGALGYGWAHRSEIKGRSTLTQQLAKNLYFTPERSVARKMNEAIVAKRLELSLSKERILELYLNVAEWGPGVFGAEAAAQAYFGQGAADLTLSQSAALAATLPHPLTSNPSFRPANMAWRRDALLQRLRGPIPPTPPQIEVPLLPDTGAPVPDTGATQLHTTELP